MLTRIINPPLQSTNGFNTDHSEGTAGEDVTIVKLGRDEFAYWVLDAVHLSYKSTNGPDGPFDGELVIKDDNKIIYSVDINSAGLYIPFYIVASPGKDLTVFLRSGGAAVSGKLNIQTHIEASV